MNQQTVTVTLTSYNMGPDATEADFDTWVAFVSRRIGECAGFEVHVESDRFGTAGDDRIRGASEEQSELLRQLLSSDLWEEWCGARGTDPEEAGRDDCDAAVREGADPADLTAAPGRPGADEALISAVGRGWVLDAAGAPDESDDSWQTHGLPWCERYNAAYAARAAELLGEG